MKKANKVSGIVDCHTHCGGIDAFNLINLRYPNVQHANVLYEDMTTNNVNYAITFPMPSTLYFNTKLYCENNVFIPSGIEDVPYALENYYLVNELNAFGFDNILPFASISLQDRVEEQCDYIRTWIEEYPIYGLKLHTMADQTPLHVFSERGKAFIDLLLENDFPIIFHSDCEGISEPMGVFALASRYPKVRFSLAHYAGFNRDFFSELTQYNRDYNNIYFDSSPSIHICSCFASLKGNHKIMDLDYSNPEHILSYFLENYSSCFLWGTDSPWLSPTSLNKLVNGGIKYRDEVQLRKRVEIKGHSFKIATVNRFLFGDTK